MPNLKLHSYEPETEPPAPLSFRDHSASWRQTDSHSSEEPRMDSIAHAEQALADLDSKVADLAEQVDEYFEPIPMNRWMSTDDDGPFAA